MDAVEITGLMETFGEGYSYDRLFATSAQGVLFSERYEVPDRRMAIRRMRRGFLRMLLLVLALQGGFATLLASGLLALWVQSAELFAVGVVFRRKIYEMRENEYETVYHRS